MRLNFRFPWQKYIFYLNEPPAYFPKNQFAWIPPHFFNLTLHYRKDSDIFFPFAFYDQYRNGEKYSKTPEEVLEVVKKKKYFAAWIVSHCNTSGLSKREALVEKMKELLPKGNIIVPQLHCARPSRKKSKKVNFVHMFRSRRAEFDLQWLLFQVGS